MKRFLATTATALILSTSAYADGHTAAFSEMTFDQATNLYASELIGMRVYATEADINNETKIRADGETEWDDIGEINDILLTRDGNVQSVIVGVGGFLGLGEKDVAIDMSQLKFVAEEGEDDDFFLVVSASAAGVKEAPEYDRNVDVMDDIDPTSERVMMKAPEVNRDGYMRAERQLLTSEKLTGARVYGVNDEDVGEVHSLLLNDDGNVDKAILDIGGFLGMGEHQIAVTLDEIQIVTDGDGDDIRVYIDSTEDALKAQPEYEG